MRNSILNIKKNIGFLLSVLVLGIVIGFFISNTASSHKEMEESAHQHINKSTNQIYTCSMHPQIKQDKFGLCPICSMDLVPMTSLESEGDFVDPNEIQMSDAALALASVQTTIVKRGIPEKTVRLLGKIKADERNISQLTARFGGRIEKLYVNYTGQNVEKGQKLGTIYSPELISAQKELLEAIKFKKTNPSFYKSARTKLKLWDLSKEQINAIEKDGEPTIYFDISSTISGTVTQRHIAIGDYIKEGSALFEVINLHKVWVMFDAYESDLPWIKIDDKINFTIQSVPGKNYSSKVTYIDPFIDAKTRVAQVRIELNNPDLILKPEMFTNGILVSQIAENSNELLIPKSSILWTGKRAVVYVKVPNRKTAAFIYREIVLGPDAGNFYVVKEGLVEGEKIAINGVFKIDAAAQLAGKSSMMNPTSSEATVSKSTNPKMDANLNHSSFKVGGSCGMCKDNIEKTTVELEGVNSAEWDIESKILQISYNKGKISLSVIHKAIAKIGYDTEKESASDDVYNSLPACCQYTRE